MPINNNNEIDKYIFNPQNPKQCTSYNLLLGNVKKEAYFLFSSDFFSFFIYTLDI